MAADGAKSIDIVERILVLGIFNFTVSLHDLLSRGLELSQNMNQAIASAMFI